MLRVVPKALDPILDTASAPHQLGVGERSFILDEWEREAGRSEEVILGYTLSLSPT